MMTMDVDKEIDKIWLRMEKYEQSVDDQLNRMSYQIAKLEQLNRMSYQIAKLEQDTAAERFGYNDRIADLEEKQDATAITVTNLALQFRAFEEGK